MQPAHLAKKNYYRFCKLEGSEYIATGFAIYQILKIIKSFEIKSILEIGLGIGSISDTVLKMAKDSNMDIRYVGTEANDFCNNALRNNIEDYAMLEHYDDLAGVSPELKFDLIIIDGQDNSLQEIVGRCETHSIIFIEGDRSPQTKLILTLFPKAKHVNVISVKKHQSFSHGNTNYFVGGGQLIFTNPDLRMKIYWFKEKTTTYIKRHLRKFL